MCHIYIDIAVCHHYIVSCGTIWLYTSHIDHCDQGAGDPTRCPNALMTMPPFTGTFDDLFAGPCNDCMASMAAPRRPPSEEEEEREDVARMSSDEEGASVAENEECNPTSPPSEYEQVPPEYEETASEYEEGLGILPCEYIEALSEYAESFGIFENEDGSITPSDDEASHEEDATHDDNDADDDDDAWSTASSDLCNPPSPDPSIWSASSTAE